ncbi:hypothetical protein HS088_TW10G00599 [Tripterygium wilfordii]|uniref:Protein PHYTOCHROME KINASE SUBSTRATE 1-like n=2 Tax=Tripterygium wilfordii TaxID=458696 RepID=A0A7J7D6A5_TRIWF|nr:hypothetical protein HS088_TW10G00599 [Tripterygium wilfordii]
MISNNLGDVSFSWFLNRTDEAFVRNVVTESSRITKSNNEEDGEIGVFSADKYFNGVSGNEESTNNASKYKKEQQVVLTKPKLFTPPSVASESSSSWHSQTALLPLSSTTVVKNLPRRKPNKDQQGNKGGGGFLASLGCKCYCSDKTSVDVVEDEDDNITEVSLNKGLNNHVEFSKSRFDQVAGKEEVLPRQSLEVFGSPVMDKRGRSLSLERRLTMLSSSASSCTPRIETIIDEYDKNNNDDGGDNYSDASSDLFEIESLTGKVKPIFLTRQLSSAESITSGCGTPTTCYAPSEASVEWSVVTASAADFSSAASDYEDLKAPTTKTNIKPISPIKGRRSGNILLGCKNQKAVQVAEDAYMMRTYHHNNVEPRMMTRFQAETKLTGRKTHILYQF